MAASLDLVGAYYAGSRLSNGSIAEPVFLFVDMQVGGG